MRISNTGIKTRSVTTLALLAMASFILGQVGLYSTGVITGEGTVKASPALSIYRSTRNFGIALGLVTSWFISVRGLRQRKLRKACVCIAVGLSLLTLSVGVPLYTRAAIRKMLRASGKAHAQALLGLERTLKSVDLSSNSRAYFAQRYVDELHMSGMGERNVMTQEGPILVPSEKAIRIRRQEDLLEKLRGPLARTASVWCGVWLASVLVGLLWPLGRGTKMPQDRDLPPNPPLNPTVAKNAPAG